MERQTLTRPDCCCSSKRRTGGVRWPGVSCRQRKGKGALSQGASSTAVQDAFVACPVWRWKHKPQPAQASQTSLGGPQDGLWAPYLA